ncbi:hypothetical protein CEQ90_12610 [Lewinellaceae bacterium SD302]|nr:hypothetical protein CEQ90_12610 [Lewinellaceae bacterium SD302]
MRLIYWLVGIGLFILALWGGGKYYVNQKLSGLIEKANEGDNSLELGSWGTQFRIYNLGLEADSISLDQRVGKRRVSGSVGRIEVNNLSIVSMIIGEVPEISGLIVERPDLLISSSGSPGKSVNDTAATQQDQQFVKFNNFELRNGRIFQGDSREEAKVIAYGIDATSEGMSIPPETDDFATLSVKIDSFHLPRRNKLTDWWIRGVRIADGEALSIDQLTLEPKQTQKKFLTTIKTRQSWNALRIDSVSSSRVDLSKVLSPDSVTYVDRLEVSNLDFLVYENPDLPRPEQESRKQMPVEILRGLPIRLSIGEVELPKVKVTYGAMDSTGTSSNLTFSKGEVSLRNVRTRETDEPLVIEANFLFDLAARVNARFDLDQNGNGRNFTMSGSMGKYELPKVNPLMDIAAKAILKTGQLNEIDYEARVENEVSKGELMFKYENLGVKLTGDGAFFKNLLKGVALRSDNPQPDGDLRRGKIYHEHPEDRPFFNLYWKSIVSGLTSTAAGNLFIDEKIESEKVE